MSDISRKGDEVGLSRACGYDDPGVAGVDDATTGSSLVWGRLGSQ
jgi:hypothetical protein